MVQVLINPARVHTLSLSDWDLLIRQGRRASLLARLAVVLAEAELLARVPPGPRAHLAAAEVLAARQAQQVRYESVRLGRVLAPLDVPLVLLKGAAYVMADLPVVRGRIFSDIDILVPRPRIDAVEQALLMAGWASTHHDAYDERYYRQWMHELPPLRHAKRRTVLDVHHTILPPTARLHPDPEKLLAAAWRLPDGTNLCVLAPIDMVLHSATHLFHDGELEHGLRDLIDLDGLLRCFGAQAEFWEHLVERAVELELARPLYYALRYTVAILGTPVPKVIQLASRIGRPHPVLRPVMDALFQRALMPDHPSCSDMFTPLARWLLYVRSHYVRMPMYLLIPHLLRKAIRRRLEHGVVPLAGPPVRQDTK